MNPAKLKPVKSIGFALAAKEVDRECDELVSLDESESLTPQFVNLFCDGIESVHRNWLAAQGLPEDYMPSWKDIDDQNRQLQYDEEAPKTIEELFASLNLAEAASKPVRETKRRAKKRV